LKPDAVVFTEPASAHGHVIPPETLAELYGEGARVARPASVAVELAGDLAGANGNVLVCGSLYLVGEILALRD
jgi:folylpolyglutamate synthase/dihydropteroate synthase